MELRDLYIDYIRALRERLANKAAQSGITVWALSAAIVYLIWQVVPRYSQIMGKPNLIHIVFLMGHISACAVGIWYTSKYLTKKEYHSEFDYRIWPNVSIADSLYAAISGVLHIGFPAAINLYAVNNPNSLEALHLIYGINNGILLTLLIPSIIALPIMVLYKKFVGYPPVLGMRHVRGKAVIGIGTLVKVSIFILVPINIYGGYKTATSFPPDQFEAGFLIAFNVSLLMFLMGLLLSSYRATNALSFLEKLERDVIMHNLTDAQIRGRLETEYLGEELGAWIGTQVALIRKAVSDLVIFCSTIDEKISDMGKLESNLVFEKTGRARSLAYRLKGHIDSLGEVWDPFQRWLVFSGHTTRVDPCVDDQIKAALLEVERLEAEANDLALSKLEMLDSFISATADKLN